MGGVKKSGRSAGRASRKAVGRATAAAKKKATGRPAKNAPRRPVRKAAVKKAAVKKAAVKKTAVKKAAGKKAAGKPASPPTRVAGRPVRKPARLPQRVVVRVRDLDPYRKCGPGTSVERLIRVDEMVDRRLQAHLVFLDRHGWYCEHGQSCHAVGHARRHAR